MFSLSLRNPAHATADDGSTKTPASRQSSAWAALASASLTSIARPYFFRSPSAMAPAAGRSTARESAIVDVRSSTVSLPSRMLRKIASLPSAWTATMTGTLSVNPAL